MPRNLVIVRVGDAPGVHLFESWARPTDYDLMVSYYGDDPTCAEEAHHAMKGGKLEGLFGLFSERPELLDQYDFVWMPDDDILVTEDTPARLFQATDLHRLAVSQPALDEQSYVNVRITARHQGFLFRSTNFVEMMAPCFSTRLLRQVLPHFAGKRFGWGVDWYWSSLAGEAIGVFDSITMTHGRRPRSGSLYSEGSPEAEREVFLRSIGWRELPRPTVHYAITAEGMRLDARNPALGRKLRAAGGRLRMKGECHG